jgi:hypothetical protein
MFIARPAIPADPGDEERRRDPMMMTHIRDSIRTEVAPFVAPFGAC